MLTRYIFLFEKALISEILKAVISVTENKVNPFIRHTP
jgi:hypothetical protein